MKSSIILTVMAAMFSNGALAHSGALFEGALGGIAHLWVHLGSQEFALAAGLLLVAVSARRLGSQRKR